MRFLVLSYYQHLTRVLCQPTLTSACHELLPTLSSTKSKSLTIFAERIMKIDTKRLYTFFNKLQKLMVSNSIYRSLAIRRDIFEATTPEAMFVMVSVLRGEMDLATYLSLRQQTALRIRQTLFDFHCIPCDCLSLFRLGVPDPCSRPSTESKVLSLN